MTDTAPSFMVPDIPVMTSRYRKAVILTTDGEIIEQTGNGIKSHIALAPLVCHMPTTAAKLGVEPFISFDILELFAFTYPARFIVPSIYGLADFFSFQRPKTAEDEVILLQAACEKMLRDIFEDHIHQTAEACNILLAMREWIWTPFVANALGLDLSNQTRNGAFSAWKDLPEWSTHAPEAPPAQLGVSPEEIQQNLDTILSRMDAEKRPAQSHYATQTSHAFTPRDTENKPNIVLGQAGTGTGKTLGYLSAAQVWAQKNEGQVWISTYTKNLQRQIDQELEKLYPDAVEKRLKTVIRKGRENYLCLLNFQDLSKRATMPGQKKLKTVMGLIARWIGHTKNGDMKGGDLPSWLESILGYGYMAALTDKRGECIHAACPHYNKCFIEKSVRHSKYAELVVANHALVMIQNALSGEFMDERDRLPSRYVFDEAHHLFDAADSAFASHLSGRETVELRRWILGSEQQNSFRPGRARGLKARFDELVLDHHASDDTTDHDDEFMNSTHGDMSNQLTDILMAARDLTSYDWLSRLQEKNPNGLYETFLKECFDFVCARAEGQDSLHSLEASKNDLPSPLLKTAYILQMSINDVCEKAKKLHSALEKYSTDNQDTIDTLDKQKIDAFAKSLKRRLINTMESWGNMLSLIKEQTPVEFLDWFVVERIEGQLFDIGFYRHWIDPTLPFVKTLEAPTHGMVMTSATLLSEQVKTQESDRGDLTQAQRAEQKSLQEQRLTEDKYDSQDFLGIRHFDEKPDPHWISVESPFDYPKQAKIFVATDLNTRDTKRVAQAYRALFEASNGGALGLFTSIQKLKDVHQYLAPRLEQLGLPLLTQHLDKMDVATLVDLFRADERSCLLGTDAIRDGVDVPGKALKLLVFDKMPWPRPNLLHKARRTNFGSRRYDERLTKLKLKQAFGRLIRTKEDKGVFVMLDSRLPTRMLSAFPDGVEIERTNMRDVLEKVKAFLDD